MKILIIGSKGFIGSHANSFFSKQKGYDCYSCDVLVEYNDEKYFLLDSTNSDFNEIFESIQFDVCINCSGAASVPDSLKHPVRDFTLNTYNVIKVLEAIRKHSVSCKFINLSSAAVYGNPKNLPVKETDFLNPVSPYGKHKWFAEEICKQYYEYFGINTCSLRIFSAFGPGLKKQLLWDVFQKSLKGGINLFGTGAETRDFIYVEDIINAVDIVIKKGSFDSSVYNVANGIEVKIQELVSLLLHHLNYKGQIIFSGVERSGDPVNWKADIGKLSTLGFSPSFSLEDGIIKYVEWLKEEKLV